MAYWLSVLTCRLAALMVLPSPRSRPEGPRRQQTVEHPRPEPDHDGQQMQEQENLVASPIPVDHGVAPIFDESLVRI